MALAGWKGFLPEKTVLMVRRRAASELSGGAPVESVEVIDAKVAEDARAARNWRPPTQVRDHEPRSAPVAAPIQSASSGAVALVYLESEPSAADRAFLYRMLSAIQLAESDIAVEWGEFPESKAPLVLGIGLGAKRLGRLSALRPDRVELPSLAQIQSDAAVKRQSWELLKALQPRIAALRGGQWK